MMKKLISLTLCCFSLLIASSDEERAKNIEELLKNNGIKAKITYDAPLDLGNMHIAIISNGNTNAPVLISEDGKTILGLNTLFLSSNATLSKNIQMVAHQAENMDNSSRAEKVLSALKKENIESYITLKGDAKKKNILYVFTDINCPYCRDRIPEQIKRAKNYKEVRFLPVGVIKEDSGLRASDLMHTLDNTKNISEDEKIGVILRIYASKPDYQASSKEVDIRVLNNTAIMLNAGIEAVPYEFESL